jgi:hypothetical protein
VQEKGVTLINRSAVQECFRIIVVTALEQNTYKQHLISERTAESVDVPEGLDQQPFPAFLF